MRRVLVTSALAATTFVFAPDATAQMCRGSLPFASGAHVQVGGEVAGMHGSTLNRGHAETLTAAVGNNKHYGRFTAARYSFSDFGQVSSLIAGGYGDQYHVADRSRFVFCPEAGLYYERSELRPFSTAPAVPTRTLALEVAGRAGTLLPLRWLRTMPFVGGRIVLSRHTMTTGGGPFATITDVTINRNYFVDTGAGILMGKRLSITGAMLFPIKIEGGFKTYSVSTAVGLGHVRP